jgi:hypothetical protein
VGEAHGERMITTFPAPKGLNFNKSIKPMQRDEKRTPLSSKSG